MILDLHIEVSPKLSVTVSHQIAEKVRRRIMDRMPAVSEVLVHIDPAQRSKARTITPQQQQQPDQQHEHGQHAAGGTTASETLLDAAALSASFASSPSSLTGREPTQAVPGASPSSYHHAETTLMRSQQSIESDVRVVLQSAEFSGVVLALTHFTCHYVAGRLSVQLELVMASELRIEEAKQVAARLDERIRADVSDVDAVDVHIELTQSHIRHARPIQDAKVGDTQGHLHAKS